MALAPFGTLAPLGTRTAIGSIGTLRSIGSLGSIELRLLGAGSALRRRRSDRRHITRLVRAARARERNETRDGAWIVADAIRQLPTAIVDDDQVFAFGGEHREHALVLCGSNALRR